MTQTIIISALCIFSGGLPDTNPDAAAEALRAAGYQIFRLSPERKATLEVEGDDFIEVRRRSDGDEDSIIATWRGDDETNPINVMWADLEQIVAPFGGLVDDFGPASMQPFDGLFRA